MDATSSSKSDPSRRQYDVFISFRGDDTRFNFVGYLQDFLKRKGIDTFVDEELRRGENISLLLEIIEQSKISIVIFSENYADSRWCLEEIEKIMDCRKTFGQVVLPVFYKVPTSDVMCQTGKFGAPFDKPQEVFPEYVHRIPGWKQALSDASEISGFVVAKDRPECDFVDNIAKETSRLLNKLSPSEFQGPGIESRTKELENLMCFEETRCVRIVGVLGMSGIGKTTVAHCVYQRNLDRFDGSHFLSNVQDELKLQTIDQLQQKLLRKLLDDEKLEVGASVGAHKTFETRLRNKKLFIVLDNVTNEKQISLLIGEAVKELYREGTRILIITRDKKLLNKVVDGTYVVPRLSGGESLELFCSKAFSSNPGNMADYKDLSNKFVDYCKGHPLALRSLGSDLCGKDIPEWKNKLKGLERQLDKKIQKELNTSYEELSPEEKSIFLDVACFFCSEKFDSVSRILSTYRDDDASNVINDLVDKCLVTISDNRLEMHDLLLKMGKYIGYESSINEVGKRGRLWNPVDICRILKDKNKGTDKIRGIFLDMSNVKRMKLHSEIFTKMWSLKFLKFYNCSEWCEKDCRLQLPDGLAYFPDELVYLHWQGYPLEYLPKNFDPEKLVVLNLRYSNIEQLWKEEKETEELRWVDLSYSKKLLNLSGLLKASKLERLDLECCESLAECSSIQEMESLVTLNLRDCIELKSLPEETNLKSLKTLILSGCSKLMNFPTISENIESLYLDGTAVERVPESIGSLRNLAVLNLNKCCSLMSLPDNFCKLKSLKKLILSGCSRLESFPDINEDMGSLEILLMDETAINQIPQKMYMSNLKLFSFGGSKVKDLTCLELQPFSGCSQLSEMYLTDCNLYNLPDNFSCCLSFLQSLCLSRNNIKNLPGSIKKLRHLKSLYLKHCENLISLPVLPSNLQYMDAHGCISLETVAKPMTLIVVAERTHSTFVFTDCFKLKRDAQENIMAHTQLKSQILVNASLQRNHKGLVLEPLSSVSFPGNDLPLWFRHQRMGSSMEIDLPPHWCDNKFIGLSLCVVVSFKNYEDKTSRFSVICKCEFRLDDGGCISFTCRLGGWKEQCGSSSLKEEPRRLNSDHVFISYNSCFHAKKEHDLNRCCNTTASFKFYVIDGVDCCEVVKCGMSLLYAPDENDYMFQELQESNLQKAVSSGKQTDLNATSIDHEAVVSKRSRFYLQEEELLNGKRLRSSNKV
ncbi:hypothetical protein N665_0030s0118 [Sinapis alba]|nr:hypothetical protein N665_0030s0118 [Sinapis alba]